MIELTDCPECGAPAEVQWRSMIPSTDGPVEHARVRCVRSLLFLLPIEMLPVGSPVTIPEQRSGGAQVSTTNRVLRQPRD